MHGIRIGDPWSIKTVLTIDVTGVTKPENSHGKYCKPIHVKPFISSHSILESLYVMTLARTKTHKLISCSEEVFYGPLPAVKTCVLGINTWSNPTDEFLKHERSQKSLQTSQVFKTISLVTMHKNARVLCPQSATFLFSHCNIDILHCWYTTNELIISNYVDTALSPTDTEQ